jgi:hypothetical protein
VATSSIASPSSSISKKCFSSATGGNDGFSVRRLEIMPNTVECPVWMRAMAPTCTAERATPLVLAMAATSATAVPLTFA